MPQPPKEVGLERVFQSIKWYFFLYAKDPHKKVKISDLSLSRTEMGMGIQAIQYTSKIERIAFIKTILPPGDSRRKVQC